MFNKQLQRLQDNIIPYACIGLFVAILIGKGSWFRSVGPIRDFFTFAGINTQYPDSGQSVFANFFDPNLLTYLLIAILIFAGLWRLAVGSRESGMAHRSVIYPLENIGSLIAIAWLGLILGMVGPIGGFLGAKQAVTFFVNIFYPLFFLIEVTLLGMFMSGGALSQVRMMVDRFVPGNMGVRIEGLILLAIGILIIAFQDKYFALIKSLIQMINGLL